MRVTCPECKLSKDIPQSSIPADAKFVTCPRCGTKFQFSREDDSPVFPDALTPADLAAAEPEEPREAGTDARDRWKARGAGVEYEGVPWESNTGRGMLMSFYRTIGGALFKPRKMFSSMAPYGKLAYPLSFAVMVGTIVILFSVLYHFFFISEFLFTEFSDFGSYRDSLLALGGPAMLILAAIFAPVWVILAVYAWAITLHLSLLILSGATFRFRTTLKVVSYSCAAQLWNIMPFIGQAIGGIWGLIILIVGLGEAHRISKLKAFLAIILLPLIVAIIGVVVSVTLPIIMRQ